MIADDCTHHIGLSSLCVEGKGCPAAVIGFKPIRCKIMEKRLSYLHKLLNMKEKRLVKQVYKEQKRLSFPNCWDKQTIADLIKP